MPNSRKEGVNPTMAMADQVDSPDELKVRRIIRVLRDKPEIAEEVRRALLTEELLLLPERFAAFATDELRELPGRFDAFVANEFGPLRSDVDTLRSDVDTLKSDVEILKADVEILKADVEILKADVEILKADVEILKADVEILKADVGQIKGDLLEDVVKSRPDDYLYEYVVGGTVLSRAQVMDLSRKASHGLTVLTTDEARALREADVVLVGGRNPETGKRVSVVAEISARVGCSDIERARIRADIVAEHGHTCVAMVVARNRVEDRWVRLAGELGVAVIMAGSEVDAA